MSDAAERAEDQAPGYGTDALTWDELEARRGFGDGGSRLPVSVNIVGLVLAGAVTLAVQDRLTSHGGRWAP